MEVDNALNGAKKLIDMQLSRGQIYNCGTSFSEYSKSFFWTNENVHDYLKLIDFNGKDNALSVSGSSDQVFSLLNNNIFDITAFDVNKLTEYIFALKKAMICKYDYLEFLDTYTILVRDETSLEEFTDIILDLLPFMEEKHKIFWLNITNYNYLMQKFNGVENKLNLIKMLCVYFSEFNAFLCNNSYLTNEDAYNNLKTKINKLNYQFINIDALYLGNLPSQYDIIILSNILDYFYHHWGFSWAYGKLAEYMKSLNNISKDNTIIFLKYIFLYGSDKNHIKKAFDYSLVKTDDLLADDTISITKLSKYYSKSNDAIVIKRVKK